MGIDFFIVAFGVFMGLQVQEWSQQRSDRNKERAYLERLSSDFTAIDLDQTSYAAIRNYNLAAMASDRNFHTMLNVLAGSKRNNYELCQHQRILTGAVRMMVEEK